jgi:hypothetical protein
MITMLRGIDLDAASNHDVGVKGIIAKSNSTQGSGDPIKL